MLPPQEFVGQFRNTVDRSFAHRDRIWVSLNIATSPFIRRERGDEQQLKLMAQAGTEPKSVTPSAPILIIFVQKDIVCLLIRGIGG